MRYVVNNLPASGFCSGRRRVRRVLKSDAALTAEYVALVARRDELMAKQGTI
jgi:hypothetical protein